MTTTASQVTKVDYRRPQFGRYDGLNKWRPMQRYRGWLPESPAVYQKFIDTVTQAGGDQTGDHIPAVETFRQAILADPIMEDLFNQIFLQVAPQNQIQGFDHLLYTLDYILTRPPSFYIAKDPDTGEEIGQPIGVPVLLIFDLLSNTDAAYTLFRMGAFNAALKDLLDFWGEYLSSPASNSTLNTGPDGWFSPMSLESLEHGRGVFNLTYVCPDPSAENYGFQSWNEFFTRPFITEPEPVRPITEPDNDVFIHSACESTVFRIENDVKLHDQFWLKAQNYSLYDMLNRDIDTANQFVGGTVYQAFLSPQDYHRWHSPVNGTIEYAEVIPGTYYAVVPDEGAPENDPDLKPGSPYGALIRSQSWLTMVSTRAVIYIRSRNPKIGLMVFIGVGMAEVSTCALSVQQGDTVNIGSELGMFKFGGSTHCMIFRPEAQVEFDFPEWPAPVQVPTGTPRSGMLVPRSAQIDVPVNEPDENPHLGKHVWINSIIGSSRAV